MPDEQNTQPTSQTPAESQTVSQPEPAPILPENSISEPNTASVSSQEPMEQAPVPPIKSVPAPVPLEPAEVPPSPESAVPVKDGISANEPFDSAQGKPLEPAPSPLEQPNITVEKHGNDVTITEIMKPEPEPKTETAQMAGNEPIDLAEEIKVKKREENLKLANNTRQEKKRKKIDAILDLFSEKSEITNDEVEKLLHISDATATRYLEILEKEGKIKQVGKTGKGVVYEKI